MKMYRYMHNIYCKPACHKQKNINAYKSKYHKMMQKNFCYRTLFMEKNCSQKFSGTGIFILEEHKHLMKPR
jgi:hypothetical protein